MNKVTVKNYKKLSVDEHEKIVEIRNLDEIRNVSINGEVIELKSHLDYIENTDDIYLAIFYGDEIIGGISFVTRDNFFYAGIFKDLRNKTIPKLLMREVYASVIARIVRKYSDRCSRGLYAFVKQNNEKSILFHENIGFSPIGDDKSSRLLKLDSHKLSDILKSFDNFDIELID